MKTRIKKYKEISPTDFLVLRERLGLRRYRKTFKRNKEEREILLELALKKMEEKEKNDFLLLGYRRRKIKII
jgi:hypothetical protein